MQIIETFTPHGPLSLTSLSFIYILLPVFVIIHRLFPFRLRAGALLGISLFYSLLLEPKGLAFMVAGVMLDYTAVRIMKKKDAVENARRVCMWFSVVKNAAVIVCAGLFSQPGGVFPLFGAVIYSLSGMSAVIDMYKRECPYELDFIKFSLYCCFFPRLYAGPLLSYREFDDQIISPPKRETATLGAAKFMKGAVKTFLFGGQMSKIYMEISAYAPESVSVLSSWANVLVFALAVYFILSGFSDMAQGIGGVFGLSLPKNFYYPYQSRGVGDFFERFNLTFNGFVKKYVYDNLGGSKNVVPTDFAKIILTGALIGLWFGFRINYFAWGAYLAFFAFLGKTTLKNITEEIPTLLRRFFTMCIVLSSFTILSAGDIGQCISSLKCMFGFLTGLDFANDRILYTLSSNWLIIAASCFFSTNILDILMNWLKKAAPRFFAFLCGIATILLLYVFTALAL